MRLHKLRVQNLRCLADVEMVLAPRFNVLVGANGAGKTSVLEAIYLLSRARSFRKGPAASLVRHKSERMDVYGQIADQHGTRRIGLAYADGRWQARLDGQSVDRLGDLVRTCAVVYFGPDSHALVVGPGDERRRFLDWGVFHVEHEFLRHWRRYRKALQQRNALLRAHDTPPTGVMIPWEREMSLAADCIDAMRVRYLDRLETYVQVLAAELQPELGPASIRYRRGWAHEQALSDALASQRQRDRLRGYTGIGIHRADWQPVFEHAPERTYLSRGQQKACAFSFHLAQAQLYAEDHAEWPVMCMDDLTAELDQGHRDAVIAALSAPGMQVFVTGTELVPAALVMDQECATFHVEHGRLTRSESS